MKIGDVYQEKIQITDDHIKKFAEFSGDFNPIHFEDAIAISQGFKGRIAHGMIGASFFSKIFANSFPGPGTVYLNQTLKFHTPVYLNELLTYNLEVVGVKEGRPIYTVKTEAIGEDGKLRISGEAVILARE